MNGTNHKAKLVVVNRIEVVLHNLGLELHVGAGHEVHPDVGVALPDEVGLLEVLAVHHGGVQLLGFRLITNLKKTSRSQKYSNYFLVSPYISVFQEACLS